MRLSELIDWKTLPSNSNDDGQVMNFNECVEAMVSIILQWIVNEYNNIPNLYLADESVMEYELPLMSRVNKLDLSHLDRDQKENFVKLLNDFSIFTHDKRASAIAKSISHRIMRSIK